MKKKGQFYLIAIIIISAMFIELLTIQNSIQLRDNSQTQYLHEELNIEKSNLLDYLAIQNVDSPSSLNIMENFSKTYINKLKKENDIIFIIGTQNSLKLIGNKFENTNISYNIGNGKENITENGEFEIQLSSPTNEINIYLNDETYNFNILSGQNIYYLIKHQNGEEVEIIYG